MHSAVHQTEPAIKYILNRMHPHRARNAKNADYITVARK